MPLSTFPQLQGGKVSILRDSAWADPSWITLCSDASPPAGPPEDLPASLPEGPSPGSKEFDAQHVLGQVGRPGLWKLGPARRGARLLQVFEVPVIGPLKERRSDGPEQLVAWAQACLDGADPAAAPHGGSATPAWSPPDSSALEALVPAPRRTLSVGPFSIQGRLVREPRRLALCFDLLGPGPRDLSTLSAGRRAHLQAVLMAASRWRLVRVGCPPPRSGSSPVVAEVDLTGAPHAFIESLLPFALDALRCVCSWLLLSVQFLCDPDRACAVWEIPPAQHRAAERRSSHV